MIRLLFLLSIGLYLSACNPNRSDITGKMDAYVPVYATQNEIQQVSVEAQQPTVNAAKIYAYRNYIFQNDLYNGIHIIDNTDRNNPKKIAFLKLPLNTDIAIKGNYLYANNYVDLVVFNIADPAKPQLVKRVNNAFPPADQQYPPFKNVYFVCPDKGKGTVLRWELKNIDMPKCRR